MGDTVGRANWAVAAAKTVVGPAAEKAEALAASIGVAVTVKATVYLDDGSKHWATVLAELLCADPSKADCSRERLAELLANTLGLESFTANRLSKPLSGEQLTRVSAILGEHGYDAATLKTGVTIRDIVKGNIRFGAAKPITISTKFYADHIEIDGVSFQYRPRERTPMGRPENDFCIRVAGVDVPLMAVLRLRNIGVGEFRVADNKAVAAAEPRQKQNREQINREYEHPAQLNRIYHEMQRATREADKRQLVAMKRAPSGPWSYVNGRSENV